MYNIYIYIYIYIYICIIYIYQEPLFHTPDLSCSSAHENRLSVSSVPMLHTTIRPVQGSDFVHKHLSFSSAPALHKAQKDCTAF